MEGGKEFRAVGIKERGKRVADVTSIMIYLKGDSTVKHTQRYESPILEAYMNSKNLPIDTYKFNPVSVCIHSHHPKRDITVCKPNLVYIKSPDP